MKAACLLLAGVMLGLTLVACAGDGEERQPPVQIITATPGQTPKSEPTAPTEDEDQIRELLDEVAHAFSQEDWSAAYELYAPSLRETCRKGEFLATINVAVEFAKAFIGKEAWEALKQDLADYEIQSIEIAGDKATVVVLGEEEPSILVREDDQWWFYEENPCEFSLFEETPRVEETPQVAKTYRIGERVDVEGHPDIVVEAFIRSTSPADISGEYFTFELEPGHEFLILTLRVINDTDLPAGVDPFFNLTLLSRGVEITEALNYQIGVEGALEAETLPVGAEVSGLVVWSARQGFDDLALQYRPEFLAGAVYAVDLEPD